MLRWFLLLVTVALLALSTLTIVRAPDWSAWKLAVLAGEFGHWLAVVTIAIAVVAWCMRKRGVSVLATSVIAVIATACFLVPTFQAWRVGSTLPQVLSREFGTQEITGPAFSASAYFGRKVEPVPVETLRPSAELPIDLYRPIGPAKAPAPCVIVVHGGGWDSGDREQLPELNHWLARRGYAVAAVSYRLAPKHIWPAQRVDVMAAIAFLKANARHLGIDATRLVLLGRSAGGQIAQVVGYTARDPSIRGIAALYAPSDLYFGYVNTHENDMLRSPALMRKFLGGAPKDVRAQYESASAINFVTAQSPPTLLLHGRNDAVSWYRHSERLQARLAESKVHCVYVELPWATHGFEYNLQGPGGQIARFALEWFLAAVTK